MSSRAKAAAALASLGILGLGWGTATANGSTLALNPTTSTTTTSTTATPSTTESTPSARTTTSTSSPTASSGSSSASSGSSAGTYADGTYTGSTVAHRYGSVAVTVTIQGRQITSVTENVVSDGERKSNRINSRAVPTLRSEVVAANSASVSTVSGATYTSKAYLTSLQSALDQAVA